MSQQAEKVTDASVIESWMESETGGTAAIQVTRFGTVRKEAVAELLIYL